MGIYGQDWASYQTTTQSVTGLSFVFLKVTEGLSYVNPKYSAQRAWLEKNGLVVGVYHYPHMHNSADAEVNYFLSKANIKPGMMVVLDWEGYDNNNKDVSEANQLAYKEEFLKYLKAKLPHNPVGLYANTDYWLNIDKNNHAGDFLWIATANKPAGSPGISYPWKFHQYGASGVDKDYGNFASKAELVNWVNGFNKTTTTPAPPTGTTDMALTKQDALTVWEYSHGDDPDVHQTLQNAASDAAAALAAVKVLQTQLNTLQEALVTAVQAAVAKTAITATVNVNGKVV